MQLSIHHTSDQARIYAFDAPPSALPSVSAMHLEEAWEMAKAPVLVGHRRRHFEFFVSPAETVRLSVQDSDAACWLAALEPETGFTTAYEVSKSLRVLALVALICDAAWARDWVIKRGDRLMLSAPFLKAAALAPLNDQASFDEEALYALLPSQKFQKVRE